MDAVDQSAAELIVDHLRASSAQMAVTQIRVLGGAVARVPAEATAFAHRARRIMVNVAALYQNPDGRRRPRRVGQRLHGGAAPG